jgi:hypothetical protein
MGRGGLPEVGRRAASGRSDDTWNLPYFDFTFMLIYTPVPNGVLCVYKQASYGTIGMYETDFRVMSDFATFSYLGSLRQWKAYLSRVPTLPALFRGWSISYELARYVSVETPRFGWYGEAGDIGVNDESIAYVQPAFHQEVGDAVLGRRGVRVCRWAGVHQLRRGLQDAAARDVRHGDRTEELGRDHELWLPLRRHRLSGGGACLRAEREGAGVSFLRCRAAALCALGVHTSRRQPRRPGRGRSVRDPLARSAPRSA